MNSNKLSTFADDLVRVESEANSRRGTATYRIFSNKDFPLMANCWLASTFTGTEATTRLGLKCCHRQLESAMIGPQTHLRRTCNTCCAIAVDIRMIDHALEGYDNQHESITRMGSIYLLVLDY